MKKKLLILSAVIGLVLAFFPFTLCAEEDPESDLGIVEAPSYYLDSYFWENYDLLPYIESDGTQYISTGIYPSNHLKVSLSFSDFDQLTNSTSANLNFLFGSRDETNTNQLGFAFLESQSGNSRYIYITGQRNMDNDIVDNNVYQVGLDRNNALMNNQTIYTFGSNTNFTGSNPIYIFALNQNSDHLGYCASKYKLYSFTIYDYSADSGDGAYVRYYYPAKSKSGGVIGLYDSVSKTFFTSSGQAFTDPDIDSPSVSIPVKISAFLIAGIDWISDILDFAIAEPLIICFIAIGLAGAMFRWGRRLVHF